MLNNLTKSDRLAALVERCAKAHQPDPQSVAHAVADVRAALRAAGADAVALESFDARHRAHQPTMID